MNSRWIISGEGKLRLPARDDRSEPLHIVYVDDHRIFIEGMKRSVLQPFFPNARLSVFSTGSDAYKFIWTEWRAKRTIDMVITDINRPGLNGIALSKCVRLMEKEFKKRRRTAVVILTMCDLSYLGSLGKYDTVSFDRYLIKAQPAEEISECLEELLY